MTAEESFSQLGHKIDEAQAKVAAAASKSRDELQAEVEQAQSSARQKADEIKAQAARGRDEAATGWQAMKDRWQAHVADLHDKAADKKAEVDRRKAEIRAEAAEDYAEDAINFAIAAAQEAEYAVLDAVWTPSWPAPTPTPWRAPADTPAQPNARLVVRGEGQMPHIVGLAFASAGSLLVQLLAVVLVILTRPRPKTLLWAFWLTAFIVSCGFGFLALAVFRAKGTFLGTTSRTVSPAIYLIVGVIAVCVAVFAATRRGRELIGSEIDKRQEKASPDPQGSLTDRAQVKVQGVKTKAEEALQHGSVWVALAVGVVLGAPTPFQLAGTGIMVRNGYGLLTQVLLVVMFSVITYIVVEIPIVSYAVWPDATSSKVTAFSEWLSSHKIQAAAAVAAVVGLVLIGKGIAAL